MVAAATLTISTIFYLWLPRRQIYGWLALFFYGLSAINLVALIHTSGGFSSPFAVTWLFWQFFLISSAFFVTAFLAILLACGNYLSATYCTIANSTNFHQIYFCESCRWFLVFFSLAPQTEKDNSAKISKKNCLIEGKSDAVISTIDDGVLAISKPATSSWLICRRGEWSVEWRGCAGPEMQSVLKLLTVDGREVQEENNPRFSGTFDQSSGAFDKLFLETSSGKRICIDCRFRQFQKMNRARVWSWCFVDITREKKEEREQAEFYLHRQSWNANARGDDWGYLGLALNPNTAQIDDSARIYRQSSWIGAAFRPAVSGSTGY